MLEYPGLQWGLYALTIVASLLVLAWLVRGRQEDESYLFLKLFGYSALGAFTFLLNDIRIPAGFLIFLLFFARPRANGGTKRRAALFGLCLFLLNAVIPSLENSIYEREQTVAAPTLNLYEFDFGTHWEAVTSKLNMIGDTRLERFDARYESNGVLLQLRYEWTENRPEGFVYYRAELDPRSSKVALQRNRLKGAWVQFNQSIPVSHFLQKLDDAELRQLRPDTDFPYYSLKAEGSPVNYGIRNVKAYDLRQSGISKVDHSQLPIHGYWINACGAWSTSGRTICSTLERSFPPLFS